MSFVTACSIYNCNSWHLIPKGLGLQNMVTPMPETGHKLIALSHSFQISITSQWPRDLDRICSWTTRTLGSYLARYMDLCQRFSVLCCPV